MVFPKRPNAARDSTRVGAEPRLPAMETSPTSRKDTTVPTTAATSAWTRPSPKPSTKEPYDTASTDTFAAHHGQNNWRGVPLRSDSWMTLMPFASMPRPGDRTVGFPVSTGVCSGRLILAPPFVGPHPACSTPGPSRPAGRRTARCDVTVATSVVLHYRRGRISSGAQQILKEPDRGADPHPFRSIHLRPLDSRLAGQGPVRGRGPRTRRP